MKYVVFFRRVPEGRAREHVDMREYINAGQVEGNSLREAERAVRAREDSRLIQVGDLLVDHNGVAWSYTPLGAWAQVKVIKKEQI